jgi:hypothetical protein
LRAKFGKLDRASRPWAAPNDVQQGLERRSAGIQQEASIFFKGQAPRGLSGVCNVYLIAGRVPFFFLLFFFFSSV